MPLLTVVMILLGFGMAGRAAADPGDGAAVSESSECRNILEGIICSESRWVVKDTATPSGNYLTTAIGDTSFTYTGSDGCTWTSSQKKREHWTVVGGGFPPQEAHVLQITETSNTCFGENLECTHSLHFLFAAGDSRIHKSELECRPAS